MKQYQTKKEEIKEQIYELLKEYYLIPEPPFDPNTGRVFLSAPSFNGDDVAEAMDSLLSGWPTIGPKTRQVEDRICSLTGVKNAVMVNSGGSANFLILYLLSSPYASTVHRLRSGDEIITPAVTWSTTVAPIIQTGCVPVFVDVNLETYDINVEQIERNITEKTRALMIVHPLGHACDMDRIGGVCKRHDLLLIEDACESLGTKYGDRYVGTYGEFATFSFYFSHHITSIEGGIIVTDNDAYADAFRSMRANGWLREIRDERFRKDLIAENLHLDIAFMFPFIGFNLKTTDFAAGLVMHQIDRLETYIGERAIAANQLLRRLGIYSDLFYLPSERRPCRHGWFAFPIVIKDDAPFTKAELMGFLSEKRIDNRPVIAGNIAEQPFLKAYRYKCGELPNADRIMRNGFFLGIHTKLRKTEIDYIADTFDAFVRHRG